MSAQNEHHKCPDCERLNQMLRQTGLGQGQIDAYVAQCEEMDTLKAEIERLRAAMKPPYKIGVKETGVTVEASGWIEGGGT